jgi:aryl-alcohol dehydrogenase-like predicted oxidoreductase
MTLSQSFRFPLRLGFGCSGILAQRWFSEQRTEDALIRAYEAGIRHFDTAGFYGGGEAERRLGRIGHQLKDSFVSTKTGTKRRPFGGARKDFSAKSIRADVDASLDRLGEARLDLLYLHGPTSEQLRAAVPTLISLKEEGKIRLAGVCGERAVLDAAVETHGVDVIMGVYNFFKREHEGAFARAKERGLGVVAIAPLAQGLYDRHFFDMHTAADVWRVARALIKNRSGLKKARAAGKILYSFEGWSPAQLALGFVLANPAVDVALTTTTSSAHLGETVRAASKPLPAEILERLKALAA